MKLYPPYKKWNVEIADINAFRSYIRLFEDGGADGIEGEIQKDKFKVQLQRKYWNSGRPQICGFIKKRASKSYLTIHLESYNTLPIMVGGLCFIILLTAIFQMNAKVLIAIPIVLIWMYCVGFLLHFSEIDKTKLKVALIIDKAKTLNSSNSEKS